MQQTEAEVEMGAAAKTAGICRLDLSTAALLIGSALAPPQASAAAPPLWPGALAAAEAAAAAAESDMGQAGEGEDGDGDGEADGATEAAAAAAAAGGGGGAASWRQRRRVCVHGNYHRYYGYRLYGVQERQEDPRLAVSSPSAGWGAAGSSEAQRS
jgi:7SK snRNA methylphosphate capping enzyme